MEGLFNILVIIGVIVFGACFSSSVKSTLPIKRIAKTTLTTPKARSTGLPKPNTWYNYRRINVQPVANISSSPYHLLRVTGSMRRNNVHFEWDYWCQSQFRTGNCSALRISNERYYYDAQSGTCKKFTYTGCGASNKNNFETQTECERYCKGSNEMILRDTKKSVYCDLQPNVGVCLGLVVRYYYDVEADDCKNFIYGGCGGNQNRFDSYELCIKRCKDEREK